MRRSLLVALGLLTVFPASALAEERRSYIVVLKDGEHVAPVVRAAKADGAQVEHRYRHALDGYAARLTAHTAAQLRASEAVDTVERDRKPRAPDSNLAKGPFPLPVFDTPPQVLPSGVDRIEADRSSAAAGDGQGAVDVNVAVVDTGVDDLHPDLNVRPGVSCNGQSTADPFGHGTLVAGIIGALDNNFGVVGVAPGVNLYPASTVSPRGRAPLRNVLCSIDWVTGTRFDADPANDIAVANASLGFGGNQVSHKRSCGGSEQEVVLGALCRSADAGVVWVTGASNEGRDIQRSAPGRYSDFLAATGMGDFDGRPGGLATKEEWCPSAPISNLDDGGIRWSNIAIDRRDFGHVVAAPGFCVLSTIPVSLSDDVLTGYARSEGTSFSAPHVTGTVALCIASGECAGLTPGQILRKIVGDSRRHNLADRGDRHRNPPRACKIGGKKHKCRAAIRRDRGQDLGYGFLGDPLTPFADGRYYGYLLYAGGY